ncbi:ABC transporter permease subunit [Methylibium sp.]|uniref:ABC transporter permease subunit n=1 Tax=Methylibium sp. TaxID=2067992 RepID=UPI003D0A2AF6
MTSDPKSGTPSATAKTRGISMTVRRFFDSFRGRGGGIWAAVLVLALLLLPATLPGQSYTLHLLFSVFLFATFGHAWNLMAGYAGLLTFGQQLFVGIGGFAQALLYYYTPASIWLAWPISGLASLAFAWLLCLPVRESGSKRRMWIGVTVAVLLWIAYEILIAFQPAADVFQSHYVRRVAILLMIFLGALPLLRLQGAYFAIATWLIAESVATVFNGWNVAGAGGGMQLKSDVTPLQLYYVALALMVVTTAVVWRWMRSSYGLALTAVRDDEDAARSSGIDVARVKAAVFLVSAVLTGLASGLYFMDVVIITPPSAFAISWASYIVFVVVAGGMGTVAGPIVGAVLFIIVDRLLGAAAGQGLLLLGALSIALMLLLPRGVMGLVHDLRHPHGRRRSGLAQWRRLLLGDGAQSDRAALVDQPGVVGAYLVPGSPLLVLRGDVPAYAELRAALGQVAREIEELRPDALVIYSTRWYAVLDQLWQGRARITGLHVDEQWHEHGEIRFDLTTDVSLARACVRAASHAGIASKLVDYAGFPLDSGSLAANVLVNADGVVPTMIVANNLYHDFATTRTLGELAAGQATAQGKRVVVLAVGELSGSLYRDERPLESDAVASASDDDWNKRVLKIIESGELDELMRVLPDYVAQARVDMGFKHFAFALGALGGRLSRARVLAYGPQYGAGCAVIRLL